MKELKEKNKGVGKGRKRTVARRVSIGSRGTKKFLEKED